MMLRRRFIGRLLARRQSRPDTWRASRMCASRTSPVIEPEHPPWTITRTASSIWPTSRTGACRWPRSWGSCWSVSYTTPTLTDVQVTPDGHVLGWPVEQEGVGHSMHLGVAADLRANLSRLGMAAGLDPDEWAQFAAMVRSRLGMELVELAGEDRS